MKIRILANIRCGGEYFTKSLSKTYGLKYYHEPKRIIDKDDSVVKYITYDREWYDFEYLTKLISDSTHVFLLDRKNKQDQIDSCLRLYSDNQDRSFWESSLLKQSEILKSVSEKLNIPITYYEDLYYNTDSVDLQGLTFVPDLDKKQYKPTTKKLI